MASLFNNISNSSSNATNWSGDPYPYGWEYNPNYTYPWEPPVWQNPPVVYPKTWTTDNTGGLDWPTISIPPVSPQPLDSKNIEEIMKLFKEYNIPKPDMEPEPKSQKPEPPKEKEKQHVGRFTDLDLDNDL